ncbi:Dual-specificity kinase, spindle pole body (SPB) duplication and spindle checkpoint function [Trapelia coarctata]|nr:Dual-specificity kinase, spindle pole body (SPB) duplication and spindle checkpoint function [Trapelia coarctata]
MSSVNGGPSSKSKQTSTGDSSDDEGSAPLLSAEAEELLGVKAATSLSSSLPQAVSAIDNTIPRRMAERPLKRGNLQRLQPPVHDRIASPAAIRSGSPRIVRLSGGAIGSGRLRRTASTSSVNNGSPRATNIYRDLNTPAPRSRRAQTNVDTNGSVGVDNSAEKEVPGNGEGNMNQDSAAKEELVDVQDSVAQMGSVTINRSKPEDVNAQGSLRIKRVGKVTGRYLSGPARRGIIRRHSDEEQSPLQEMVGSSGDQRSPLESNAEKESKPLDSQQLPEPSTHETRTDGEQDQRLHVQFAAKPAVVSSTETDAMEPSKDVDQAKPSTASVSSVSKGSSSKRLQPVFKMPPLPALPSRHDQENEPPPTFKRNKPNGLDLLEKSRKISIMHDEKMLADTPATASPSRKPLAPRSHNTPLRPAPPPPKMTVLDTVTATVGAASAAQSKKKRNYISVNGKLFTRMDCIGRGGSAKVYRVMAENYKVFALKRVSLEDVDDMAIRGYKGEIELLRKLENEDRVIRLFDYEINDARQTLSILMEMGESDLSRVLNLRLNADNAVFDISFTRYFWKEMLECVQAVHQHGIVHSDLKPANFLLVQGRLKLIDFGIANAIQDDTVNVHREQQIGTPNYMSPEALIDANAVSGLPATVGKVMKLGRPSDVWSLGCILYQMVYGKPPFAHITNQLQRVMAIPNPSHVIQFPGTGVGGAPVPTGLIVTLRQCLDRNLAKRPKVQQLLADTDPFLHPDTQIPRTVPVNEELIGRLQRSIIKHIQERGIPSEAELSTWPVRYFASIKAAVEEGRA